MSPRPSPQAWLVAGVDPETGRITSMDIFSEPNPTTSGRVRLLTVCVGYGITFTMGVLHIAAMLESHEYAWAKKFLAPRATLSLGTAKELSARVPE